MPVDAAVIGLRTEPLVHEVDARWTMAYSAGLGDTGPVYLDTARSGGVVAHPLFTICPEWPVVLAARDRMKEKGLTGDEHYRGVHATHDCRIHRLVRPGDTLSTQATIVGVERRRPGAYVTLRLETTDARGAPVATTWQGSLYREVEVLGEGKPLVPIEPLPPTPEGPPEREVTVPIAAEAAHVYTECARIWNPIHTDRAVALAAGLPDIILHGSATLALAVSRVVDLREDGDPGRVRRITGSFRGMVRMPSSVRVALHPARETRQTEGARMHPFTVLDEEGHLVIRDGSVTVGD